MRKETTPAREVVAKKENWVTVRVWLSKVRQMPAHIATFIAMHPFTKSSKVGHVSLETEEYYASHWPMNDADGPLVAVRAEAAMKEVDINRGGGPADFQMTLYSLDVDKINEAIDRIIDKRPDWVLVGDLHQRPAVEVSRAASRTLSMESSGLAGKISFKAPVNTKDGPVHLIGAESCASLVMGLLDVGGIANLDPDYTRAMSLTIKTPNNMARYTQEMREKERRLCPYSETWSEEDRPLTDSREKCIIC